MKKLEKEYEVHRFDIKTSEKKIFKKYTDTIKSHQNFDIRLQENKWNELIKIQEYSIQKIFYMIKEYPEEYILFLFLSEYKMPLINKNSKKHISLPTLDTSELSNNQLNSSDIRLEISDLESPTSNPEIIKENNNPQYICIFSILYYIIAGLLLIHLLKFIFSKEVSMNKFIIILIIIILVYILLLHICLFILNWKFWIYRIFI